MSDASLGLPPFFVSETKSWKLRPNSRKSSLVPAPMMSMLVPKASPLQPLTASGAVQPVPGL